MRRDQNTYPKNEGFFWVEENDDDAGTFHFTSCSTFLDRSRFLYKTTCILIDALRACERDGRRRERQKINLTYSRNKEILERLATLHCSLSQFHFRVKSYG